MEGALSSIQYTYAELPYADWGIHPTGPNRAVVHIRGLLSDVDIEVGEGQCRLLAPQTEYTESHLRDKWIPPSLLFKVIDPNDGYKMWPE